MEYDMEPILLYGHPAGSPTGLIAAFEWLGQPYRLSRLKMPDDMASARFDRLNPRREVPVLITDDRQVLSETIAIALWLERRDTERRISFAPGTRESNRLHQLIGFLNSTFTASFGPLWIAKEAPDMDDLARREACKLGRMMVAKRHRQLETIVSGTAFFMGDHPTLADAVFLGVGRWIDWLEAGDPSKYSKSFALRQRIEATPAARFALASEAGDKPTGTGNCQGHVSLDEVIDEFG
jgi:glutathione S-transferase